jgi:hypothetical protein
LLNEVPLPPASLDLTTRAGMKRANVQSGLLGGHS